MNYRNPTPLQVSTYDRTNGFLIASIILWSFLVAILFVIWMTHVPIQKNSARPLDTPGEDFRFTKVVLKNDSADVTQFSAAAPQLEKALEAIPDIVSKLKGATQSENKSAGLPDSDGRDLGPAGEDGSPGKPDGIGTEGQRWRMTYSDQTFDDYAAVLKYFEIEIGLVRLEENEIVRLKLVNEDWEVTLSDRKSEQNSFYFVSRTQTLKRWDRAIAKASDLDLENSTTVHFYSKATLDSLRNAETGRILADGREFEDVVRTTFEIVRKDGAPTIKVTEIEYR